MPNKEFVSDKPEVIYEASWAPKDPRDRMYDQEASRAIKAASFIRIAGSYHPVLNLLILFFDLMKKVGVSSLLFLLLVLPALVGAIALL